MCKVSVVMGTYNGAKYIKEQLKSLLQQTMQPDQVIISDDCSTDDTVVIVDKFIKENKLNNWKITINKKNKGWKKNFYDALCMASGDIIFMCDQDDIWIKDKIESMYNEMLNNPKILCLVGYELAIDAMGNRCDGEEKNEKGKIEKIKYKSSFFKDVYKGCVMCISKEILTIYKGIKCDYVGHDMACAHMAILKDGMYLMKKAVIYHRYHGGNATKSKVEKNYGCGTLEKRIEKIQEEIKYFTKLKEQLFVSCEQRKDIQKYVQCLNIRCNFLVKKKLVLYIKRAYLVCNVIDLKIYIGDIAYALGLNKQFGKIGNILLKK